LGVYAGLSGEAVRRAVSFVDPRLPALPARSIGAVAEMPAGLPGPEAYHAARLGLGVPEAGDFGFEKIFALDGGLHLHTEDEVIPFIPPVVERSTEPDGRTVWLINDGIHRVYAAHVAGSPINVVTVDGASHPYYALAASWDVVVELEELPDNFQKKAYRVPENYKALFRDFNAVFPGVQQERKRSNPAHLAR